MLKLAFNVSFSPGSGNIKHLFQNLANTKLWFLKYLNSLEVKHLKKQIKALQETHSTKENEIKWGEELDGNFYILAW